MVNHRTDPLRLTLHTLVLLSVGLAVLFELSDELFDVSEGFLLLRACCAGQIVVLAAWWLQCLLLLLLRGWMRLRLGVCLPG